MQVENKPLEATLNRPRGGRVCPPFRKRQRAPASRSVQASLRCHNWAAKAASSAALVANAFGWFLNRPLVLPDLPGVPAGAFAL